MPTRLYLENIQQISTPSFFNIINLSLSILVISVLFELLGGRANAILSLKQPEVH